MSNKTKINQMSVADAVRAALGSDLPAKVALAEGYANASALARRLRPRVEAMLGRPVEEGAIVSALRRARAALAGESSDSVAEVLGMSSVAVRTDIYRLSLPRSRASARALVEALRQPQVQDHLVHLTEGLESITIAVDSRAAGELEGIAPRDYALDSRGGLAAIVISSPPEIKTTPGCLIPIYMKLYEAGINIEDTTSSHTDTLIIVDSRDAARAFSAISELIESFRSARRSEGGRGRRT